MGFLAIVRFNAYYHLISYLGRGIFMTYFEREGGKSLTIHLLNRKT